MGVEGWRSMLRCVCQCRQVGVEGWGVYVAGDMWGLGRLVSRGGVYVARGYVGSRYVSVEGWGLYREGGV